MFPQRRTSWDTTPCDLPQNEPKAVHVGHDVRLEVTFIQSFIQNLRRHVALCAHFSVGRDVDLIGVAEEPTDQREGFKLAMHITESSKMISA